MLTYEEAVKEFPDEDYENGYDPIEDEKPFTHLITGTRAEVRAAITVHRTSKIYIAYPDAHTIIELSSTEEDLVEDEAIEVANARCDFECDLGLASIVLVPIMSDK
jgi:hypothetical protein